MLSNNKKRSPITKNYQERFSYPPSRSDQAVHAEHDEDIAKEAEVLYIKDEPIRALIIRLYQHLVGKQEETARERKSKIRHKPG